MLGDKIAQLRKEKGLTQRQLSEELKIAQSTIGMIEKNERGASNNLLLKLAKYFNVSVDYLLSTEEKLNIALDSLKTINEMAREALKPNTNSSIDLPQVVPVLPSDIVNIPIVGTIRAGQPLIAIENVEGYFPAPKSILNSDKEYFYLRVKGDSMNLKFPEGALLLVEKCNYIENGEIGVVLIDGQEATVKKIVKSDNMITLIPLSNNPEHIPMMYDLVKDEVRIIGKAKMANIFL